MTGRFGWFLRRREKEAEMDREFRAHLETEIEERIARGMEPDEARRTALVAFGNVTLQKDAARRTWFPRTLDRVRQDLVYAARTLRRNPGLAAVVVLSLGLGIGVNTVVFSLFESVVLRPFPYEEPGRLVFLWAGAEGSSLESQMPGTDLEILRDNATLIESVAPYAYTSTEALGDDSVRLSRVGPDLFRVLGVQPVLGPGFADDGPESAILLSYGFWQRRFGGDPEALGESLEPGGAEIVGVMPRGFFFPEPDVDVWSRQPPIDAPSPLAQFLPGYTGQPMSNAQVFSYLGVARLAQGVSVSEAQAEVDVILRSRESETPARLHRIHDTVVGDYRLVLWMLLGAVGLLLLLAATNVANLLLARGIARQKELAIRGALGAGPGRLAAQLLTESLLLALIGGAGALLFGYWGIRLVLALGLVDIPRVETASINWSVALFAGAATLGSGLVAGVLPAWQASRNDPHEPMKSGIATTATSPRHRRLRDLLVVAQVAMALVLLIGTGLLVRSSLALARFDWGFDSENVVGIVGSSRDFTMFPTSQVALERAESSLAVIRSIPGVEAAAVGVSAPLVAGNVYKSEWVVADGSTPDAGVPAVSYIVSPGYFRALGVPIRGQSFGDSDPALRGVILNEALALRLFGEADPTGQVIHLAETTEEAEVVYGNDSDADGIFVPPPTNPAGYEFSPGAARRVIGVSEDFRMMGELGRSRSEPALFLDYRSVFGPDTTMARNSTLMRANKFLVRSTLEPTALVEIVRARLSETDPYFEIESTEAFDTLVSRAIGGAGRNRLMLSLALVFGTLSLLLAAIGVYGAASHAVSRRTPEFCIRMALGARRRDVVSIVLVQTLGLAIAGLTLGLGAALAATRVLESVLFQTNPSDTATFAAATLFLLSVTLGASLAPALRAAAADPVAATRTE